MEQRRLRWLLLVAAVALSLAATAHASLGDKLDFFKECVATCVEANCELDTTPIPLHRRLLLWTCPSECDYSCQHIVSEIRLGREYPYLQPIIQFHGKWPFYRFFGVQEPFSVLFSLFNYLAHLWGMAQLRERVPAAYPLRKFYLLWGYFGLASWAASMVFHTRDFSVTEKTDYFAAGASVLCGLYYSPIRIFRLDDPQKRSPVKQSLLRVWSAACILLYAAHVSYLSFWSWDYTYNMAANVAVGTTSNLLWSWFSWRRYRRSGKAWQAWPGMIVAWVVLAMSLEIYDFSPWHRMIDAHSLWHLGTVGPTIWWYTFLVKDAEDDLLGMRAKA